MLSPRQETAGQNGRGINGYAALDFTLGRSVAFKACYNYVWRCLTSRIIITGCQPPLINPCIRFSRTRLSDVLHRKMGSSLDFCLPGCRSMKWTLLETAIRSADLRGSNGQMVDRMIKAKWLDRRGGKRKSFTWAVFSRVLQKLGIAKPRIIEKPHALRVFA